jgi:predicted nucleic acid-binding protein
MDLIADTTVLIDVWRFRKKRPQIQDLIEKAGDHSLAVPWIVQAEFTRGALHQGISRDEISRFLAGFLLVTLEQSIIDSYCDLWVVMAKRGKPVDYPDLWIAAYAITRESPLLTRNPKHFQDIPGLEVLAYAIRGDNLA